MCIQVLTIKTQNLYIDYLFECDLEEKKQTNKHNVIRMVSRIEQTEMYTL